jgi:hypothetical protein
VASTSGHLQMALAEGQQKLCCCYYHHNLVVEPHHLLSISCSLQIHAAPMFHSFQTDKFKHSKHLESSSLQKQNCMNAQHCPSTKHSGPQEYCNTCGKHIGMPPRVAFGGLKIAFMGEQKLPKFTSQLLK